MSNFDINNYQYIDFHTHMHDKAFDVDSDEVMQNIIDKKILCVTIGTDLQESKKTKALSDKYAIYDLSNLNNSNTSNTESKNNIGNIFYTIGVHPHDNLSATFDDGNKKEFEELLGDRCVAIGECGLDYFYLKSDKEKGLIENMDREIDKQRGIFINQIKFALKHNLPLMIHGRCSVKDEIDNTSGMDAYEDILEILEKFYKKNSANINGNIHFFTGNINIAQRFMDLGFTFSFGGVLTLTHDYDEVVKYIPIDHIHAETDSPYVTPKDTEGKKIILNIEKSLQSKTEEERKIIERNNRNRNSSENISVIVAKISEIKNLELNFVKEKLKENFVNFLR